MFRSSASTAGSVLIMATSTDECLRYDINLAPKELETQLRIDPTLAKKSAAYNRNAGKPVRVRPVVKKISLHDALREYFDLLDTDKSGTLSFRELNRDLTKIGMTNKREREAIMAHFQFMDKDGSGQISFDEFLRSTLDAGKPINLADEQYTQCFDKEMFIYLSMALRSKLKADFERDRKLQNDDPLSEFLQYRRLVRISQAAIMPSKMCARIERVNPRAPQAKSLRTKGQAYTRVYGAI